VLRADGQADPGRVGRRDHGVGVRARVGHRLLDQDVLSGPGGPASAIGRWVGTGVATDDRVDVRARE